MVVRHHIEGYQNFLTLTRELENKSHLIYILFCGSKGSDGSSWCPDCVSAEPVIEKALTALPEDAHFIHVGVGNRETWKDPGCPFRTDNRLKLTCVPTLIRWGGPERLEDSDCARADYVEMMFESS